MISGYMGSGQTFDDAIGEFAVEYGDQNRSDYRAFVKAIRGGPDRGDVRGLGRNGGSRLPSTARPRRSIPIDMHHDEIARR